MLGVKITVLDSFPQNASQNSCSSFLDHFVVMIRRREAF